MNTNIKPIQAQAHLERQARIDLAACHRIAARFELHEAIDNHMTLLVPGCTDRFYLAPFGMHWSEIKASDFCEVDLSGRLVAGKGPIEPTALYIHAPVHRLAPRARCVLHTHMPYATALTMLEQPGLRMAVQSAVMFHEDIAFVEYHGLAYDQSEGERLAHSLGDKSVLMMRNPRRAGHWQDCAACVRAALLPRACRTGTGAGYVNRANSARYPAGRGAIDARAIQRGGRGRWRGPRGSAFCGIKTHARPQRAGLRDLNSPAGQNPAVCRYPTAAPAMRQ